VFAQSSNNDKMKNECENKTMKLKIEGERNRQALRDECRERKSERKIERLRE